MLRTWLVTLMAIRGMPKSKTRKVKRCCPKA